MFPLCSKQVKVDLMRMLAAVVLLLISQVSAHAERFIVSAVSTTALVESCRRAGDQMRADCSDYILGVFDRMSLSRLICPPENLRGISAQAVAVGLKFLNDHPEQWHHSPALLIGEGFKAAFP